MSPKPTFSRVDIITRTLIFAPFNANMYAFTRRMMALMMIRTQIQLKEQQLQALKARASQDHVSVSELIRRAVEAWFAREGLSSLENRRRRAIEAAGRFASGQHEVAKHHDEHLADIYRS